VLAVPAQAAQVGVPWLHDLEAAKTTAKHSGRLVLVHFWTPTCQPCLALEQNVFNQIGVAGALEAQFVPVKLNANDHAAVAQAFGITRVPTDVIITPEGHVVGKLISPPTPGAYVAELSQLARQHATRPGQGFETISELAPVAPKLNAAYANLQIDATIQRERATHFRSHTCYDHCGAGASAGDDSQPVAGFNASHGGTCRAIAAADLWNWECQRSIRSGKSVSRNAIDTARAGAGRKSIRNASRAAGRTTHASAGCGRAVSRSIICGARRAGVAGQCAAARLRWVLPGKHAQSLEMGAGRSALGDRTSRSHLLVCRPSGAATVLG
jgi:thiol-disulfide isomerase/thioredoxin